MVSINQTESKLGFCANQTLVNHRTGHLSISFECHELYIRKWILTGAQSICRVQDTFLRFWLVFYMVQMAQTNIHLCQLLFFGHLLLYSIMREPKVIARTVYGCTRMWQYLLNICLNNKWYCCSGERGINIYS